MYIYDNDVSATKPLEGGGFTTEYEHISEWCRQHSFNIEHFSVDENADAKAIAEQQNLTVFPVLFRLSHNSEGQLECKKYAEGIDAILLLSDDNIKEVAAYLATLPPPAPPQ